MISLALVRLEMYKNPSATSFTLKKSNNRATLGTPRPLSLKKTRKPTKKPQNLGESWDKKMLKCCKMFLIKGCRGKRRPFSNAASKKQTASSLSYSEIIPKHRN